MVVAYLILRHNAARRVRGGRLPPHRPARVDRRSPLFRLPRRLPPAQPPAMPMAGALCGHCQTAAPLRRLSDGGAHRFVRAIMPRATVLPLAMYGNPDVLVQDPAVRLLPLTDPLADFFPEQDATGIMRRARSGEPRSPEHRSVRWRRSATRHQRDFPRSLSEFGASCALRPWSNRSAISRYASPAVRPVVSSSVPD